MTPYFETELGKLFKGDCIEVMASLDWQSIDMVLCDLPFNLTNNDWDIAIDFKKLWWLYGKLCKKSSPILLFGIEPFSSKCRLSNLQNYKHDWKWLKTHSSGRHLVKYRPTQLVEDVMVFGNGGSVSYSPKMIPLEKPIKELRDFSGSTSLAGSFPEPTKIVRTHRYPSNVLEFPSPPRPCSLHPCQKSLDLCKYLIETYSLPNQVVLDNCAGSGTSLLAAEQLGRRWIGIERETKYCRNIRKRFDLQLKDSDQRSPLKVFPSALPPAIPTEKWVETTWLKCGDANDLLEEVPAKSIQSCITSPPYWQLRDYGVSGQLGLEATPEEFVAKLADIFDRVHRTLTENGTLWLNLDDTYCGGGGYSPESPSNLRRRKQSKSSKVGRRLIPPGYKRKDLVGIPWMVALELRRRGWYLRCDIVWEKPNGWGSPSHDRPSRSHEYLFLFSKSEKYFFDGEAIKIPAKRGTKCCRSVWSLHKSSYRQGSHTAMFPEELVRRCILASTKPGQQILDPFMGSGTTGEVARSLGRFFVGFDLNPVYMTEASQRLDDGDKTRYKRPDGKSA